MISARLAGKATQNGRRSDRPRGAIAGRRAFDAVRARCTGRSRDLGRPNGCHSTMPRPKRGSSLKDRTKGGRMADETKPGLPERRRGSGVQMVYDVLRDEILDLAMAPVRRSTRCSSQNASASPARPSAKRSSGWPAKGWSPRCRTARPSSPHRLPQPRHVLRRTRADVPGDDAPCGREPHRSRPRGNPGAAGRVRGGGRGAGRAGDDRDQRRLPYRDGGRRPQRAFHGFFNRLLDQGRRILRIYYNAFEDRCRRGSSTSTRR